MSRLSGALASYAKARPFLEIPHGEKPRMDFREKYRDASVRRRYRLRRSWAYFLFAIPATLPLVLIEELIGLFGIAGILLALMLLIGFGILAVGFLFDGTKMVCAEALVDGASGPIG